MFYKNGYINTANGYILTPCILSTRPRALDSGVISFLNLLSELSTYAPEPITDPCTDRLPPMYTSFSIVTSLRAVNPFAVISASVMVDDVTMELEMYVLDNVIGDFMSELEDEIPVT